MLLKLNRNQGATLVIVTHDPALSRLTDRIVYLRDGRIVDSARASITHQSQPDSERPE